MTIENHTSPYEFIKRIAREFEVELRFRVETDGQRITGRYVDMLERIGEWRGRQVEFGRDLDGIRRIEKQDIVTALLGLGPEKEDGTRMEVLVEDEDALQRWGRVDEHGNLHHLIEVYEIQSDRQEMTETEARQYTRTAVDKRINTQVGYETTVVDLEEVPGMSNKKIRFGDTLQIKDTEFNPPLYLEARVYEMTRSLKHKAKKDIKLGDYIEYTEEEVSAVFNQLRNEIRRKVSMAQVREYAEPKIIESATPPPIEQGENAKWIDTSGEIKVPHVVVGDEWVKMSPTEHDISDADRLSSGIIDVGQVPLRTSVSGARIEWDGVNGLVQYDANNNVVTHLSLDGDTTFSGHLEGATGTFISEGIEDGYTTKTIIDTVISIENSRRKASIFPGQITFTDKNDGSQFLYTFGGMSLFHGSGNLSAHISIFREGGIAISSNVDIELLSNKTWIYGSLELQNASGTSNALEFPSGHMISEGASSGDWFFYGNRANGQYPFVVRSHVNGDNFRNDFEIEPEGTIVSHPTRLNESSNSANVRIGTSSGRFFRTTSSRRAKLSIENISSNPYNILKLEPRDWYDKTLVEEYENALNRKYDDGEEVDFDELEPLQRIGGLIAEEVEEVGLEQFVEYDRDGKVVGLQYDRLWTLLIPIVKDLKERLDKLESN